MEYAMATLCLIGLPDFTSAATFFRKAALLVLFMSGILWTSFFVIKNNIGKTLKPSKPSVALLAQNSTICFGNNVINAHLFGFRATNLAWLLSKVFYFLKAQSVLFLCIIP